MSDLFIPTHVVQEIAKHTQDSDLKKNMKLANRDFKKLTIITRGQRNLEYYEKFLKTSGNTNITLHSPMSFGGKTYDASVSLLEMTHRDLPSIAKGNPSYSISMNLDVEAVSYTEWDEFEQEFLTLFELPEFITYNENDVQINVETSMDIFVEFNKRNFKNLKTFIDPAYQKYSMNFFDNMTSIKAIGKLSSIRKALLAEWSAETSVKVN